LPISFFNRDNKEKSSSRLGKRDNPYIELIIQVPLAEVIFQFTTTASSRVQDTIKSTILSLISTLLRIGKEVGEINFKL